ncbi:MAG: hypothetical protein IT442_17180, partial [Phycisphaeraceae bacterium]|nr:hypothetical protein [Phycisphaeraceae bacterium]
MTHSRVTFTFRDSVPMAEVESTLRLAVLAVESLHGEDRVRLETQAKVDRQARVCVIDTSLDVGRTLATVFGGFVRREFGEEAVDIQLPRESVGSTVGG